jgi:transaldolase
MKFFLDSAMTDQIVYARENWKIDGVTTNPRHIMTSGKPFRKVIREIADIVKDDPAFPVSVEINPHLAKRDEMIAAAEKISAISPNFVIKLPCVEQGFSAGYALERRGIRTNMTLAFSSSQTIQAGRIGAKFVSPFVAWKEEAGEDCQPYVNEIVAIYRNYRFTTEIIVAALRNARQIAVAAIAGAHIVTAGFDVYKSTFDHAFTDRGLGIFQKCWDSTDTSGT